MKEFFVRMRAFVVLMAALVTAVTAASAVPKAEVATQTASIGFDPPLDEPLRYRWEKTVQQDGKSRMSWSVQDYVFEEAGDGYRLTVKPVSSGNNESDAEKLAMMKKIEELIKFPYVLRINEDAEIVELERAGEYWAAIFKVLREFLGSKAGARPSAAEAKAVEAVIAGFEKMPADARLALLTEPVQPLVEFAATETTMGSPIFVQVETATPFGGTVKRDFVVSLTKIAGDTAHISMRASLPRSEFDKLLQSLVDGFGKQAMTPANLAKMKAGFADLKDYKHEARADYRVSMEDGVLESFESTETIEITESEKVTRRVTSTALTRVP